MVALTIGKIADQAGVNVETIRFYERQGLIEQPPKPHRSFRHYPPEAIKRVRFIREAQKLGFSLKEISGLLDLRADPSADCQSVRASALAKRGEIESKIKRLKRIDEALESLISHCPREGRVTDCPIIAALDQAD